MSNPIKAALARTRKGERRRDEYSVVVLMGAIDNWVMVRRPGCMPWAMLGREWLALPLAAAVEAAARDD